MRNSKRSHFPRLERKRIRTVHLNANGGDMSVAYFQCSFYRLSQKDWTGFLKSADILHHGVKNYIDDKALWINSLETFTSWNVLRLCATSLSAKVINMADPTQLSGMGGGYVDNKMLNYIFSKGTERKKFPLSYLHSLCMDQKLYTVTRTT